MSLLGFDKHLYSLPFDHSAVAEIACRYQEFVGIFEIREKGVPA